MAKQLIITLTPELEIAIDDWFHNYRCRTRSDAARKMLAHAAAIEAPELKPGGRKALYNLEALPVERPVWRGHIDRPTGMTGLAPVVLPWLGTQALWTEGELLEKLWRIAPRQQHHDKGIALAMKSLGWKQTRMVQDGEAVTVYLAPVEGVA